MLDKTVSQADIAALMADIGRRARAAARPLSIARTEQKNAALEAMAKVNERKASMGSARRSTCAGSSRSK